MTTYDQNAAWFQSMFPYAKRASDGTGVPVSVILSQWGLETGYGTSDVSKQANNYAGIKYVNQAEADDGNYGAYAKYSSIDQFVMDYVRVMGLGYYKDVRAAGSPEAAIQALDASPWAEDTQYGSKVSGIFSTYGLRGYDTYKGGSSSAVAQDTAKLAAIGAAAVALFALLQD